MNESKWHCPYCRGAITSDKLKLCPACGNSHHKECWRENRGCTVYGCSEAPADEEPIRISSADLRTDDLEGPVPRTGGIGRFLLWSTIGIAVALLVAGRMNLWPDGNKEDTEQAREEERRERELATSSAEAERLREERQAAELERTEAARRERERATRSVEAERLREKREAAVQARTEAERRERLNSLPEIRILSADWGKASLQDISKILVSSAEQLWPHAAQPRLAPILVSRSNNGPIVFFRRGSNSEYLVDLNTQDYYWSQYAFQFSSMFGHILCGSTQGARNNYWFEESLCETASLFVLRQMTEAWKTSPPYPHWKSYGPQFRKYAQERIKEHPWPADLSVALWHARHRDKLRQRGNSTTYTSELIVPLAAKLLPLFEQQPDRWGAVAYLNFHKTRRSREFHTYLADWKKACPQASQKEFVSELEKMFGIEKP